MMTCICRRPQISAAFIAATGTFSGAALAGSHLYTVTNLGIPEQADSVVGVRMNNHGHVAGWSQYFGAGEPSLRGWVWTPEDGFTILPLPPGFFEGRSRAMDINDNGVVGGDGGFDIGLAWRYQDGVYEITGSVQGMPGAYLGGINNAGDLVGTAKDAQIITPDYAWVDFSGGDLMTITPTGGRATDINNVNQVCGYLDGLSTPFHAYRWSGDGGLEMLGSLGLAYSFAHRMNDSGDIVGVARSASGNTNRAWIYTDEDGMQLLPAPFLNASTAVSINNGGHVVGISSQSGPDFNWLWTGGDTVTNIASLFDTAAEQMNVIEVRDINNAGQILVQVFDNSVAEFRMIILTPPDQSEPVDMNGDGAVDGLDLGMLLANWSIPVGSHGCGGAPVGSCPADLNADGVVDGLDLGMLLAGWIL